MEEGHAEHGHLKAAEPVAGRLLDDSVVPCPALQQQNEGPNQSAAAAGADAAHRAAVVEVGGHGDARVLLRGDAHVDVQLRQEVAAALDDGDEGAEDALHLGEVLVDEDGHCRRRW